VEHMGRQAYRLSGRRLIADRAPIGVDRPFEQLTATGVDRPFEQLASIGPSSYRRR